MKKINNKSVKITKVVSRNIIMDWVGMFQNLFGQNLSVYEKMLSNAFEEIDKELESQDFKMKWFRYEITQLTNGAVVVVYYGERV